MSRINIISPATGESYTPTMATLPDNVLLDIFDFYRKDHDHTRRTVWKWHLLVHVCRRWRQVIFESPLRLDLQIHCTCRTPVRKSLSIWPALPIVVDCRLSWPEAGPGDEDNALAALEHPYRVGYLKIDLNDSDLGNLALATLNPFPMLTHLILVSKPDSNTVILPAEFLGGFAPRLQIICLRNIVFPALPTLLVSASGLVELQLRRIRRSGYISPVAMALCFAALPRLKILVIRFQFPIFSPHHDQTPPPPVTRTVVPSLTDFEFTGASEYLEELVSLIDGPRLNRIVISYLIQVVDFQVVQLSKFFDRSVGPEMSLFKHAKVRLDPHGVTFNMYRSPNHAASLPARTVNSCRQINWEDFRMDQVFSKFSAMLSTVIDLKLVGWLRYDYVAGLNWVHLLHQLSTVQALYVSWEFSGRIVHALRSMVGEAVANALFSRDLICLEGYPSSVLTDFAAAFQHSGRPVTVVSTEAEFDRRLESR